jgi:hypothetical protein
VAIFAEVTVRRGSRRGAGAEEDGVVMAAGYPPDPAGVLKNR